MKLNNKTNKLFSACLFLVSLLFVSCYDEIFHSIRKEVEPVEPNVFGPVYQIARFQVGKETLLVAANGNLMAKVATTLTAAENQTKESLWRKMPVPDISSVIHYYGTVADEKCLYALAANYYENEEEGEVDLKARRLFCYSYDDATELFSWKEIEIPGMSKLKETNVSIFGTNAPMASHRRAFLNNNGIIYELSNGAATLIAVQAGKFVDNVPVIYTEYTDPGKYNFEKNNLSYLSSGCCWFNGDVVFHKNKAITTNEVSGYGSPDTEATAMWFADGRSVYLAKEVSGIIQNAASAYPSARLLANTSSVYALGVTANSILCGTNGGMTRIVRGDLGPMDDLNNVYLITGFDTNAGSMLNSYYDVVSLLILDSSKKEKEIEAYAGLEFRGSTSSSVAQFDKIGLYSYYKERGNWNRE